MDIQIFNFKHVRCDVLVIFILFATIQSQTTKLKTGPKREVVSIYNEKFTTPENRHPYFIEVYRCVAIDNYDDVETCGGAKYPIQDTWKNITIVVPDRSEKKFYKYVVYNHTSCKCEGPNSVRKLRWSEKGILVSKATFYISKANNPTNLRDQCDYCNNPQPRFYENPNPQAQAEFKHIAYKQCLPGCVGSPDVEVKIADTWLTSDKKETIYHTNHLSCEPYDDSNKNQIKNTGNSLGQGLEIEVVSIYNENFTTPPGRYDYFIEVQRCVQVLNESKSEPNCYTVKASYENVTIVVPDTTNEMIFYKYVVENHTSCTCGGINEKTPRNDKGEQVSKDDFLKKHKNNPVNLRMQCDFCNETRPRYKVHQNALFISPEFLFLPYNQCLPGCVAKPSITSTKQTRLVNGSDVSVSITDHTQCEPSSNQLKPRLQKQQRPSQEADKSFAEEPNYELLLYIGSGKLMLVAFLLSLVLFTVLIVDFTFCRREKGFLYALCSCKNVNVDDNCERCTHRHLNEITV